MPVRTVTFVKSLGSHLKMIRNRETPIRAACRLEAAIIPAGRCWAFSLAKRDYRSRVIDLSALQVFAKYTFIFILPRMSCRCLARKAWAWLLGAKKKGSLQTKLADAVANIPSAFWLQEIV